MIKFSHKILALIFGAILSLASAAERPNIILIMTDDQGWGETSYNGHSVLKTPHLDAMAANGLRFDRFYAGSGVCSPTRSAMLTGRTPNRECITGAGGDGGPRTTLVCLNLGGSIGSTCASTTRMIRCLTLVP